MSNAYESNAYESDAASDQEERLDDDKLPAQFPPDEPMGVDEDEVTVAGQETDEPLEERMRREVPDTLGAGQATEPDAVGTLVDPEAGGLPDETKENVAEEGGSFTPGRLDPGDTAAGDDTTRDVATERYPGPPAEEAAIHTTEPPPMGDGDGYVEDEAELG